MAYLISLIKKNVFIKLMSIDDLGYKLFKIGNFLKNYEAGT